MSKIALITDTTCDLSEDIIDKYNIKVLPFRIIYKDKEYRDKIDITPEEVYDNMSKEVPTSSMPSMHDMEKLFTSLEEEGYTHAIVITLSTGLSGIYNGVRVVSEHHPKINTFICDSKSISMGEGALVEECAKLIESGKSFEEVIEAIPYIKERIHLFFIVPTLEYLKKGGRIGKVAGTIAEVLDIKPIISPDSEGKYSTYAKVRGKKQAMKRLFKIGKDILKEKKCKVYVMNGSAQEDAQKLYDAFKDETNISELHFGGSISPVSGVHSGPGLVGLVLVEEP